MPVAAQAPDISHVAGGALSAARRPTRRTLLGLTPLGALAIALLSGVGALSCTLPPLKDDAPAVPVNACRAEDDVNGGCGPEARCSLGICRAIGADALPVLFEVSRTQLAGLPVQSWYVETGATLGSLVDLVEQGKPFDLGLPLITTASISVKLPLEANNELGCRFISSRACGLTCGGDATVAVRATLRPASQASGLPALSFGDSSRDPLGANPPRSLPVSLQIPPDSYDIYLEQIDGGNCLPPLLTRARTVTPDVRNDIDIQLTDAPNTLDGTISADPGFDLTGFSIMLVDPRTGLRISTIGRVRSAGQPGSWVFGVPVSESQLAPLDYYTPFGQTTPVSPYLVLSPPPGLARPTFAWQLASVTPFDPQHASLQLTDYVPQLVSVDGRLERDASLEGVESRVWLQSIVSGQVSSSLSSTPPGVPAFYAALALDTDESGLLSNVPLLPGEFEQVSIAKTDPSLAIRRRRAKVGVAGGGVLDDAFEPKTTLDVRIFATTSDAPVVDVPFEATASLPAEGSLERIFGRVAILPRPSVGLTSREGHLLTPLDEGLYDLTVRFPMESGFPWLVKPRVLAPLSGAGQLRVSPPVEVVGTLFDRPLSDKRAKGLSRGTLRAYVLLPSAQGPDGRTLPASYVRVAEVPIDAAGRYRLLLPSRL